MNVSLNFVYVDVDNKDFIEQIDEEQHCTVEKNLTCSSRDSAKNRTSSEEVEDQV